MTLHTRFRTHTATVERRTRSSDGAGGWIEAWSTVGTVVGSLQPAGAAETERGDRELAEHRWVFYCDPDSDLARDDRLTVDDQTCVVLSVARWYANSAIDHWAAQLEERQEGT